MNISKEQYEKINTQLAEQEATVRELKEVVTELLGVIKSLTNLMLGG